MTQIHRFSEKLTKQEADYMHYLIRYYTVQPDAKLLTDPIVGIERSLHLQNVAHELVVADLIRGEMLISTVH